MAKKKKSATSFIDPVYEGPFGGNTDYEDEQAYDAVNDAAKQLDSVAPANLGPIDFQDYTWGGDYTPPASVEAPELEGVDDVVFEGVDPRLADLSLADPSAFNDISVDPRLKDQQMAALGALEDISRSGGLTAADEAVLNRVQSEVSAADRGRREAIRSGMAARGMGGSGMELLQMLDSSQAATDRANQAGLDVAGMAEQRALDAMINGGNLAGSIRGQDFGEQAQIAAANDAINRFNTANSNQWSQFNAGQVNDMGRFNAGTNLQAAMYNTDNDLKTQMFNTGNKFDANKINTGYTNDAAYQSWAGHQNLNNANVDTTNKERLHNLYTLPQTRFENDLQTKKAKADAAGMKYGYWNDQGKREEEKAAGKAGIAGSLAAAGIAASDKRVKKNVRQISDEDIGEFLSAVEPKKFRYKEPGAPGQADGDRLGFILQDVADTKLGKDLTREGEDGKLYYDRDNLDGVILAALSSLAKGKGRKAG